MIELPCTHVDTDCRGIRIAQKESSSLLEISRLAIINTTTTVVEFAVVTLSQPWTFVPNASEFHRLLLTVLQSPSVQIIHQMPNNCKYEVAS